MSKLKLITKEKKNDERNLFAVKKKIVELKKRYMRGKYNHVGELYEILSKLVKLKQVEDSKYTPRSLEWEKDLKITSGEIRFIFAYKYISSYAKEKIKEGLIDDVIICNALAHSSLLRDINYQNKFIDKLIKNEIKIGACSELTKEELGLFLMDKLKVRKDEDYFLSAIKSLRSMKNRIKDRKNLLKNSVYRDNLISAIRGLNELID